MATSIPPHNVAELCDALQHLIKAPNATFEKLVELVPGPDFPTGGILCEDRETVVEAYRTGKGRFRIRARWEVEKSMSALVRSALSTSTRPYWTPHRSPLAITRWSGRMCR